MRKLIALMLGAVLVAVSLVPAASDGAGRRRGLASAKMCITSSTTTGKQISWRCPINDRCCYDALLNQGSCVPASGVCL